MRRDDVAPTFIRCHFGTKLSLGNLHAYVLLFGIKRLLLQQNYYSAYEYIFKIDHSYMEYLTFFWHSFSIWYVVGTFEYVEVWHLHVLFSKNRAYKYKQTAFWGVSRKWYPFSHGALFLKKNLLLKEQFLSLTTSTKGVWTAKTVIFSDG